MFLVTGGAGFIGSNLLAALCARGEEVMVCDRLRDGGKWHNIAPYPIAGIVPPEVTASRCAPGRPRSSSVTRSQVIRARSSPNSSDG